MIFVSRKIVYSFFLLVFLVCFLSLVYVFFFNEGLVVKDPSVSLSQNNLVLKMTLYNASMHSISGIKVTVKSSKKVFEFFLNGDESKSVLRPGERYDFLEAIELSESLNYTVFVSAPFSKTIPMNFELKENFINPVLVKVIINPKIYLNEKYSYSVELCNVSDGDLPEVIWVEGADEGFFKESFIERSISLKKGECKTIYSPVTPIKLGTVELKFYLRVGPLSKGSSKVIEIVERD